MDDIRADIGPVARRRAEEWVAQKVLTDIFHDLSRLTVGMRLAASHYALMSSASPLAINRARRA